MLKNDDKLKIEKYIEKIMNELVKDAKESMDSGMDAKEVIEHITKVTVNKVTPESKMIMSSVYKMLSRETLKEEVFQNTENKASFYETNILGELNNRFVFEVPDKIEYSESKNELDKWIKGGSVAVVATGCAISIKLKSMVAFAVSIAVALTALMGLIVHNKSRSRNKTNINSLVMDYFRSVKISLMDWIESIESYYDQRIEELKEGMNA